MCRLALWNKAGERYINGVYGLEEFMLYLENECGGAGNGVAVIKNGKVRFMKKGVEYTCRDIASKIRLMDYDYCIFHTRVPSVGAKTDANCHPYRDGDNLLCMNGTERDFKGVADVLGITDTEAVFQVAMKFNVDLIDICSKECESTFIGLTDRNFNKGTVFITAKDKAWSGIQCVCRDNIILFASTLPKKFTDRCRPKKYPFVWKDYMGSNFPMEQVRSETGSITVYTRPSRYENMTRVLTKGWDDVAMDEEENFLNYNDYSKDCAPHNGIDFTEEIE